MKSDHRHELKQNELAQLIDNLPQLINRHRNTIIYVAILVVLIVGAAIWKNYQNRVVDVSKDVAVTEAALGLRNSTYQALYLSMQGQDGSSNFTTAAEALKQVADSARTSDSAALALLKSAEAVRLELSYTMREVTEQEKTDTLNNAISLYNQALEKAADNPVLEGLAKFGLGISNEELGNFDLAKTIYNEIVSNERYTDLIPAHQAALRLSVMDSLKQDITFIAVEEPLQLETPQPSLEIPLEEAPQIEPETSTETPAVEPQPQSAPQAQPEVNAETPVDANG